jgi:hypothetical protein
MDASALAKRYAQETGIPLLDHLFTRVTQDRLYLFNVGIAEVFSILVRKKNAGHLSAAAFAQAFLDFGVEIVNSIALRKIIADDTLVTTGLPLVERHSINATDAILLRSALDLAVLLRIAGDNLVLMASDQRLQRAARAEGLATFDPKPSPRGPRHPDRPLTLPAPHGDMKGIAAELGLECGSGGQGEP